MNYYYNPVLQERVSGSVLQQKHGVLEAAAEEHGWFKFAMNKPETTLFYHYSDGGMEHDEEAGYSIKWEAVPYPLDGIRETLKAQVAAKRYDVETAGIEVNGLTIKTDRESQATIGNAVTSSNLDPSEPVDWKGSDGWVQLDNDTIVAMARIVGTHVRECFKQEKAFSDLIDAAETTEDLQQIDISIGWPNLPTT